MQEAINHNISEIERLKKHQTNEKHEENSRKKYVASFSQNAEQLSLGNKSLTLAILKQIYEK